MVHLRIILFLVLFDVLYGCITPDGQPGMCILVKDCPRINRILNDLHRSHAENKFFAASVCGRIGSGNIIKVCCEIAVYESNHLLPILYECGNTKMKVTEDEPTLENREVNDPNQYPWMALIEYRTESNSSVIACGGTLISNKYILTAAHCVVGPLFIKDFIPISIRLGDRRIGEFDCNKFKSDCEHSPTRLAIEKIIPHPQFDPNDPLYRNDIALVRFSRKLLFTENVGPICLSINDVSKMMTGEFVLAGWGTGSGSEHFNQLKMHKKIYLVEQNKCNDTFSQSHNVKIWEKQFCAGDIGQGNCVADGGNGLMLVSNGKYSLAGIVSIGSHMCNNSVTPDIFTNVYQYNGWIAEQIVG